MLWGSGGPLPWEPAPQHPCPGRPCLDASGNGTLSTFPRRLPLAGQLVLPEDDASCGDSSSSDLPAEPSPAASWALSMMTVLCLMRSPRCPAVFDARASPARGPHKSIQVSSGLVTSGKSLSFSGPGLESKGKSNTCLLQFASIL